MRVLAVLRTCAARAARTLHLFVHDVPNPTLRQESPLLLNFLESVCCLVRDS